MTVAVSALALAFFGHAKGAEAVKPSPPLSLECSTVSSSGMTYKARCTVKDLEGSLPDGVLFKPVSDGSATITDVVAPGGNGLGDWFLTVTFQAQKPVPLPFEAKYAGGITIRVTSAYNPFVPAQAKAPSVSQGVVIKDANGQKVREYLSK